MGSKHRETACAAPERSAAGEAILAAAEALFAEKGFEATSVNEVARRAGVSKANVFHHFRNKKALYLAVMGAACRDSRELLFQTLRSGASVAERLAAYQRHHLESMLERQEVSRLVLREVIESTSESGRELAQEVFDEGFSVLVDTVREGQTSGELRPELDPALIAHLLIASSVLYFQGREVLRHTPQVDFAEDPARYSAMAADVILNGCLRRRGPSRE